MRQSVAETPIGVDLGDLLSAEKCDDADPMAAVERGVSSSVISRVSVSIHTGPTVIIRSGPTL